MASAPRLSTAAETKRRQRDTAVLARKNGTASNRKGKYLLTLDQKSAWYARHGFAVVDAPERVPSAMAFEMGAGKALSFLLGNRLVCMRGGGDVS